MLKRWSAIWLCCTVPLAPHHAPLLPVTVPSFPSLSPPPHHCPLLPITVPLLLITVPSVLSFPSLSPPSSPSHHCPLRPLLPITVPSSPSLSPPSHHCPLLPITVPSSPSLSPPPHHIMLSWQIVFSHYSQDIPSSPQSSQLKRTPLELLVKCTDPGGLPKFRFQAQWGPPGMGQGLDPP